MILARPDGRPLRCFIGFFGITRSFDLVIDSIERRIFAPLERAGIEIVRAAHLNRPDVIDAARSGEDKVPFRMPDLSRLRLDREIVEPQSIDAIAAPLARALSIPLIYEPDPDGAIRRNLLHQLYSLKRLGGIWEALGPGRFDFVMIARPDLRYLDAVPVRQILAQLGLSADPLAGAARRGFRPVASLVTPSWHAWGGMNDRFAFATQAGARTFFNRIDKVPAFCAERPEFQGEALLRFAAERDGLAAGTTWMRAERVRSDGRVAPLDVPGRKERLRRALVYPLHRALQV